MGSKVKSLNDVSKNRFNKEVKFWTEDSGKDIISWERKRRLEITKKEIETYYKDKKCTILEIGCGAGFNISELAKHNENWTCLGTDIAPQMIQHAKKKYKQQKNLQFEVLNIDKAKIKKTFDVIFLMGVIGYLEDNKRALEKIASMMKKDSLLIFTYGNSQSVFRILRFSTSCLLDSSPHFVRLYNSIKKKIRKDALPYSPLANIFVPFKKKRIHSLLEEKFKIVDEEALCFSAGFFGSLSVKSGKFLEKYFHKNDPLKLGMTNLIIARKK